MNRIFFSTLVIATVWSSAQGASLTRGPIFKTGHRPRGVRWRTDTATDTLVAYGPAPGSPTNSPTVRSSPLNTNHPLGLSPNALYYYSVGSSSQTLAGNDTNHYFITFRRRELR
jgi:hypothetical protein